MADMMMFPDTVEEFMEQYKMVDKEQIYSNGIEYVPIFRMKQWFEHVSDTDTISRQAAIDALGEAPKYKQRIIKTYAEGRNDQWFDDVTKLTLIPSAQPERKKGKWIKEYWNGEHTRKCSACNITQTVTTYRGKVNFNYCPYCGARMEGESDV